jgi:hypothetical protein
MLLTTKIRGRYTLKGMPAPAMFVSLKEEKVGKLTQAAYFESFPNTILKTKTVHSTRNWRGMLGTNFHGQTLPPLATSSPFLTEELKIVRHALALASKSWYR